MGLRFVVLALAAITFVGGDTREASASGYIVYDMKRAIFGAAVNRPSWTAAREGALRECHRAGGRSCSRRLSFGAGYCGALAVQSNDRRTGRRLSRAWFARCSRNRNCWPGYALYRGRNMASARSAAMRNCTKYGFKCRIVYAACSR